MMQFTGGSEESQLCAVAGSADMSRVVSHMPDDLVWGTEANLRSLHLGESLTLRFNLLSEIGVMLSCQQASTGVECIFSESAAASDIQDVKRNVFLYVQHADIPISDLHKGQVLLCCPHVWVMELWDREVGIEEDKYSG
jgi:hypothetical protein